MDYILDFEKPVQELENQIKELKVASQRPNIDLSVEIEALQKKVAELTAEIYQNLSPWERVQLSRHPLRPHSIDYIENLIEDFHEIHGDRFFSDDSSVIAGMGFFKGLKVVVVGIEKGLKTNDKIQRNFGMAHPEGYRKALRAMKLASRFNLPVVTFVDTPGAYPGIGAEERGQAQAIAQNLEEMFGLEVPVVSVVIGEGGSGGALGLAIADKVLMQQYSIYSVISPESCASILWSDPKLAERAANSLQLGPEKALELEVIDGIITEPAGGAHRNPQQAIEQVGEVVYRELVLLQKVSVKNLLKARYDKFRNMGNKTIG